MAEYLGGTPMQVGSPARLWKGGVKTNGMLEGSPNSRVPALVDGFSSIIIDPANPLFAQDVVTWGNGLWFDQGRMSTQPGALCAQAPAKPVLMGVFKFNQGWQSSNPIQPYGMPSYSTGNVIRKGLVGYETAMAQGGSAEAYMQYLIGDSNQDVAAVRTLYNDWITAWEAAAAGSKLGLFMDNASGFPVVAVVAQANLAAPTLTGCTFAGFAELFMKEHERIYFDISL